MKTRTFRVRLEFEVDLPRRSSVFTLFGNPPRIARFVRLGLEAMGVKVVQVRANSTYKIIDVTRLNEGREESFERRANAALDVTMARAKRALGLDRKP